MNETIYTAVGKRKTSVAKVFLKEGSGKIVINQKPFDIFFASLKEQCEKIKKPLILNNIENQYDLSVQVKGGGVTSQLEAIQLAIAKSICEMNPEYRQILGKNGLLRRDSRIKERRKYGLRKARKAPQYSKR